MVVALSAVKLAAVRKWRRWRIMKCGNAWVREAKVVGARAS
jgi:hypothetical protein